MKKLLLVTLCLISVSLFSQQITEKSPYISMDPEMTTSRDTFNLSFSFEPLAFVGDYGIGSDGNVLYVTQWYGDSIAKYDQFGTILDIFTIPTVERVRDLGYDGQYYYCSRNADFFYVLDLDNKLLVDTVHTGFNMRGMDYDPVEGVLWTSGDWEPKFHKIDLDGNILDFWIAGGMTMNSISGLAVDNSTYGGPFLWGFSQDSSGAMIIKYDIATQMQTGSIIDVSGIGTGYGIAGGLSLSQLSLRNQNILCGMLQNDMAFGIELSYANQMVSTGEKFAIKDLNIYPNPSSDYLNIDIITGSNKIRYMVLSTTGQIIKTGKLNTGSQTIDISNLKSGSYIVKIEEANKYSLTKKIVIQ